MDNLQTDVLCDNGEKQESHTTVQDTGQAETPANAVLDASDKIIGTENFVNGSEDIIDPLDLIDTEHCENEENGHTDDNNSDVWKGSDSEEESFEKITSEQTAKEIEEKNEISNTDPKDEDEQEKITETPKDETLKQSEAPHSDKADDNATEVGDNNSNIGNTDKLEVAKTNPDTDKNEENSGDSGIVDSDRSGEQERTLTVSNEEKSVNANETVPAQVAPETTIDNSETVLEETAEVLQEKDKNDDGLGNDDDMDYEDDFDPLLLCPEVSMAIEDSTVITNSETVPGDENDPNSLPYEQVFSTYVDEVTGAEISFNLTPEEQELRKKIYSLNPNGRIERMKIHCTACNVHLGSALEGQNNRFVHPMLKVLICKECYHFYTSGEFEKDEDGSELYCRWCGQGGQVLCCSKCEYVFCKKCIRTNFGRKKLVEVRDSDEWSCFRCNPNQLKLQRVACYEFFEYVRRETARAVTLNDPSFLSQDYTRCCDANKRKATDEGEQKKTKKRKLEMDPDYSPLKAKDPLAVDEQPSTSTGPLLPTLLAKPIKILPKFGVPNQNDNDIEFVGQITPSTQFVVPSIRTNIMRPPFPSYPNRSGPQTSTVLRFSPQTPRPVPPLVARQPNVVRPRQLPNNSSMMKHEWFEKTVRAAARVNSHLSYTLTQLNKAQSQAASVEELAVVHNKLQEILSSSINSLIQIRKNLRTEFISGIKTIRFPPKKTDDTFVNDSNDDDVIFVSTPILPQTSHVIVLTSSTATTTVSSPTTSTATTSDFGDKPRFYLKVKSFSELQKVPADCITIPDDPPFVTQQASTSNEVVCNGVLNSIDAEVVAERKTEEEKDTGKEKEKISNENMENGNKENEKVKEVKTKSLKKRKSDDAKTVLKSGYNVKDDPSLEVKRMLSVKVRLERMEIAKPLANGSH